MRLQAISRFYYTKGEIRLNCRKPRFFHFVENKNSLFFSFLFFYIIRYILFFT